MRKVFITDIVRKIIPAILGVFLLTAPEAATYAATTYAASFDANASKELLYTPFRELVEKGDVYFKRTPMAADSAMTYYYAATYRYLVNGERSTPDCHLLAARALDNMAVISLSVFYDYGEAYSYLMQARKIAGENGMPDIEALTVADLSVLLGTYAAFKLDDNAVAAEANRSFLESITLGGTAHNWRVALYGAFNVISFNFPDNAGMVLDGIREYRKLKDVRDPDGTKAYVDTLCLGAEAYLRKDYATARTFFSKAAEMTEGAPAFDREGIFHQEARMLTARTDMALGDRKAFEKALLDRYRLTAAMPHSVERLNVAKSLHRFYAEHGDRKSAEQYLLDFYRIRDSLYSTTGMLSMSDFRMKAELNDINRQVAAMTHEKERNRTTAILIAAALLIVICCLVWAIVYYRKKQRLLLTLYEKNRQLLSGQSGPGAVEDAEASGSAASSDGNGEKMTDETSGNGAERLASDPALVRKIKDVLLESDEVFDPDFQMSRLCDLVGSNYTYVSHAINTELGKNFKTLVTERRIREACRLLDDGKTGNALTMEGIGRQAGFKSRVTFTRVFKSVVGITPSEYRDAAMKYSKKKARTGINPSIESIQRIR